jgi:hypothetical protein
MTIFAHSVEVAQQSAEIELLMAAGLLAAGTAFMFWRSGGSWASLGMLALSLGALAGAFVLPRVGGPPPPVQSSDAFLSIARPKPSARLEATQPIEVEVILENAPLTEGGELELLIDGRQRQTSTSPQFRIRLLPGEHRLTVRYSPPPASDRQAIESSVIVIAE